MDPVFLKAYQKRLAIQSSDLFDDEADAALDFLESSDSDTEFRPTRVENTVKLKHHLRESFTPGKTDPQCRFVFVHTPNSRAPLKISHDMFCFLVTYHQVMPAFLDFVFPFGKQEYERDFVFGGFREENSLDHGQNAPQLLEQGRSGCELRLCYNLRSVEPTSQSGLPWSIRQTAIYHSFDFENGRSLWITVKGNNCIRDRISESLGPSKRPKYDSKSDSFSASLETHLLLCDWAGENWRWYTNDLESQLQKLTRATLSAIVDKVPDSTPDTPPFSPVFQMSPRSMTEPFSTPSRSATIQFPMTPRSKSRTFSSFSQTQTLSLSRSSHSRTATTDSNIATKLPGSPLSDCIKGLKSSFPRLWATQPIDKANQDEEKNHAILSPDMRQEPPELPPELQEDKELSSQEDFDFTDLQQLQSIEEKTQEAVLVLKLNVEVLQELKQHYCYISNHGSFPIEVAKNCRNSIAKFEKCVLGVEKDLRIHQARTETLPRLVSERKTLLFGILQYRSMRASEFFAKRAQKSADHMESMTISTHQIAQKTKQETVSMRIITLVTLFFLPGTFIGTFMSTDIIRFESNNTQVLQPQGLKTYLAICLPLMVVTFFGWYIVYWWAKKDDDDPKQNIEDHGYSDKV